MITDYRMNGIDPGVVYNLQITRGLYSQLFAIADLKDNGLSIDWAGENGTERYHGQKRFKSKMYSIPCAIICNSAAEFDTKWNAFKQFLTTAAEFNLDVVSRNRRFKVSYLNMTGYSQYANNAMFTLVLADDYPTENFTIS